jgi:dihydrolipoamide dehydrogenase
MKQVDVAVIGAGHAGLNAIKEIRKQTDDWILINGGPLGTTCARVGCMPSKAAIELANLYHARHQFEQLGIRGAQGIHLDVPQALEEVRDMRDMFVDLVLANTTDEMDNRLIRGYARFLDVNTLIVDRQVIHAKAIIIATGSSSVIPCYWQTFADKLLTVENLFEQPVLPKSIAVIGLGPIGLELGQALARLGVSVTGIDQDKRLGRISDPEVNAAAQQIFSKEFPLWLGEPAQLERAGDRLRVIAGTQSVEVDNVLLALGRQPNVKKMGLDRLPIELDERGVPHYDPHTLQVKDQPIFIAGDATGGLGLLQKAADEGRIAGFNALQPSAQPFKRKVNFSILFSDPNIACIGTPWEQHDLADTAVGQLRFGPVGRAMIMRKNRGLIRVYAEKSSRRLLGGSMIGPGCEHLAHLLAWAVQQQMTVDEALQMPFYHPVIEEALQDALHDLARQCDVKMGNIHRFAKSVSKS